MMAAMLSVIVIHLDHVGFCLLPLILHASIRLTHSAFCVLSD